MNLPHIKGGNPHKIHEFYAKLLPSVQALESMNKLREISGYCRATLDRLEGIRADLTRLDDNWQEWGFPQLVTALGNWTERNPANQYQSRDKSFATNQNKVYSSKANNKSFHKRACIYCDSDEHKSIDCKTVTTLNYRLSILKEKRVCFNCTGFGHRAVDCRSKGCHYCNAKHHSSVCDKKSGGVLLATGEVGVVYPVVIVKGVTCRALLDTGSGSTYVSNRLVEEIGKKPIKCEQRQIDMMMSSATIRVEVYSFEVSNTQGTFNLKVDVTKVEKRELLSLPNPKYKEIISKFEHLRGVVIEDTDEKKELPVHMIIGTSDFSKIKTPTKPRVGKPGEPVAELTLFGWMMMSPGHELEYRKSLFARSSSSEDYERLCSLDVLDLESRSEQNPVHQEFKDQLETSSEGWYQTGLIWKAGIPDLPSNESGSKARLKKLVQRLEKQPELYDKYEEIIKEQEKEGIIERAPEKSTAKEFYLPHRAVVKQSAESSKIRIVFYASAKADDKSPSLNDCLETGPSLQNLIWNILVRNRMQAVMLSGDLKQAFFQIRIREQDRDVLRFHWPKDRDLQKLEIYRFTRAIWGLNQSPFLLEGTIEKHLDDCKEEFSKEVEEIKRSKYVDDVFLGGETIEEVQHLKETSAEIFSRASFKLHKWHSNRKELVKEELDDLESEESFAKQQLKSKESGTKLLGLGWNESEDTISISFEKKDSEPTKRGVLQTLASIYDPLGIVSPVTLMGKIIFQDICDQHLKWDSELPEHLRERWRRFVKNLPDKIEVPHSISMEGEIGN